MTGRCVVSHGFGWAIFALFFCLMIPAATAQEKTKSIWVKADELMAAEKYEEAVKLYSIAIEINADDPDIYSAYFYRGQGLLLLGKVDDALSDFTETIKRNPRYANAYKWRGIVYFKTNRYVEATNDFSRFIELEPDNPYGYVNRGSALAQIGNYDKALADFNRSIEIDATCADCYYKRYQIYTVMGRDAEAELDLEKAQSLDPAYKGVE